MNLIEWLQTTTGVVVSTLGTVGVGTLIVNVVAFYKNLRMNGSVGKVNDALIASAKANEGLAEQNKEILAAAEKKVEEINKKDLQLFEIGETIKLMLEGMSYIISAAGGIDDVTKVKFISSMKEAQDNISNKFKEIALMAKEEAKEKAEVYLEKAIEKSQEVLNTTTVKAQNILDKYSKR